MKDKNENNANASENKNQTNLVLKDTKEFDAFMEQNPGSIANVVIETSGGKDGR